MQESPAPRSGFDPHPDTAQTPSGWIGRHQRAIWRFLRYLGAGDAADDLLQETLVRGLQRRAHELPVDESRAFLRRIAHNLLRDRWRREGRRRSRQAEVELDSLAARFCDEGWDEEVAALRLCVAALSARERMALELRYAEGASREDIGRSLGCSEAGAKTLLRRVRARLRACVRRRLGWTEAGGMRPEEA